MKRWVLYKLVDGNKWYLIDAAYFRCVWTRSIHAARWYYDVESIKRTRRYVRKEWNLSLRVDEVAT